MDTAQKKVGKAYDANHSFKQAVKKRTNRVRRAGGKKEISAQVAEALQNLDNAPKIFFDKFMRRLMTF